MRDPPGRLSGAARPFRCRRGAHVRPPATRTRRPPIDRRNHETVTIHNIVHIGRGYCAVACPDQVRYNTRCLCFAFGKCSTEAEAVRR